MAPWTLEWWGLPMSEDELNTVTVSSLWVISSPLILKFSGSFWFRCLSLKTPSWHPLSTYILHLWLKFQSFFLFFLEQHKCNTPRFWPCSQFFYLILLDGQFRNLINRSIMAIMNWKAVLLLSVFGFSHMQMLYHWKEKKLGKGMWLSIHYAFFMSACATSFKDQTLASCCLGSDYYCKHKNSWNLKTSMHAEIALLIHKLKHNHHHQSSKINHWTNLH